MSTEDGPARRGDLSEQQVLHPSGEKGCGGESPVLSASVVAGWSRWQGTKVGEGQRVALDRQQVVLLSCPQENPFISLL